MIGKKYAYTFTAVLCAVGISTAIHALNPGQRGAIQDLTKQIKAKKLSSAEVRKKALNLKIPAKQMNDFIVQELISVADAQGISDIFNATLTTPATALPTAKAASVTVPKISQPTAQPTVQKIESKVIPAPAENPAVQELYNDYKIFSKSIDSFKPGSSYVENKRRLMLFTQEYERMVKTVVQLSTDIAAFKPKELHPKDRAIIEEFSDTLLPAIFQKLHNINDAIEKQEKSAKRAIPEKQLAAEQAKPAIVEQKAPATQKFQLQKNPYTESNTIWNLVYIYVNKDYTADQVMNLRKKNKPPHQWGSVPANPFAALKKDEMAALVQEGNPKKLKLYNRSWDIVSLIDHYYWLNLAKLRFKELGNVSGLQKVNFIITELLAKNGNDTLLVVDEIKNKTPIKNKYFVEIIDEFEKKQNNASNSTTPSPTIQDFPAQKIDKLSSGDEKDYFRAEPLPEVSELIEGQEDIMLGGEAQRSRRRR